ncbi:hypothetical protein BaRGS_00008340 [Batillaria attramentaria]|uniref:Uncharacterized protein n=1 Tax=Batillaria attramentaria TaxID=370345 RepID=A0ABD0LN72_9CAEN
MDESNRKASNQIRHDPLTPVVTCECLHNRYERQGTATDTPRRAPAAVFDDVTCCSGRRLVDVGLVNFALRVQLAFDDDGLRRGAEGVHGTGLAVSLFLEEKQTNGNQLEKNTTYIECLQEESARNDTLERGCYRISAKLSAAV